MSHKGRRIVIGISGASGAIYAVRTVRALLLRGYEVHLIVTKFGERLLAEECGIALSREGFVELLAREKSGGEGIGTVIRHDARDLGAAVASGSYLTTGMVVVPCSAKTLGGIANGYSTTLIERAADVCLKERRRLILVVRETPLSLVHLRNMVRATEAGAIVVPASPGFYQGPESFEDLADFIAGRTLNLLGIEQELFRAWGEEDTD